MAKETVVIGGLPVHLYRTAVPSALTKPLLVVFLLHGRAGSAGDDYIEAIATSLTEHRPENAARDLLAVTFDHRNHGHRLVLSKANSSFREGNDQHAIDMYSIQVGTARDVSFLIDFLPAYIFPSGERSIVEWGVVGVSLGGHSTWIALSQDPRVTIGVPVIACPDFLALLPPRAKQDGIEFKPPHFPDDFVQLVKRCDPAYQPHDKVDSSNPFLGKKVLVLSGGSDPLVPFSASQTFVENLQVGKEGIKKVIVYDGVGHACTPDMIRDMTSFIGELL